MTGIGRLRTLAGEWDAYGLGGTLGDVARQIERERACDADTIENVRLIVGHVIDGMERHVSGVEGADDSPVARWARELRGALESDTSDGRGAQNPSCADADEAADVTSEAPKVTRDPAEDVSMSAYDLLPEDERDAIAWVREHGGLDYVRTEWRSRVPHDLYERKRQRLLRHIAECETALGRRREIISELTHRVSDLTRENAELRRRAIPEGVKWPRHESGEPVGFGDEVSRLGEVFSIFLYCDGSFALNFRAYSKGERVRRPAKVLDAYGVEIRVGQTVWDTDAESDTPLTVVEVSSDLVRCEYTWKDGKTYRPCYPPDQLTHTKPEPPDSWERIEEDARGLDSGVDIDLFSHTHEDIVRRCRALAERDR